MWTKEQYEENQGKVYEILQEVINFEKELRRQQRGERYYGKK